MRRTPASILVATLALAACSSPDHGSQADMVQEGDPKTTTVAYGYTYRFALPTRSMDQAQDRHIALCDQLGIARCRMLEMHRSEGTGSLGGLARFVVAAPDARRFGETLIGSVTAIGGELQSRDFEAQDLAAERTEAQERTAEKNSASNRAALSAVRERLRMSTVWTYYEGTASFGEQVGGAFAAMGDTLTTSIVMLIYFLAGALPWALVLTAIVLLVRAAMRWAGRMRAERRIAPPHPVEPTA